MNDHSPRRIAALALAHAGVPTFPCIPNEKRPATTHGLLDRSADMAVVQKWFDAADYNLAFVPDDIGCFVVDLDPKHDGITTWRTLCAEHAWQPVCNLMVRTPSGGWHLYFKGSLPPSVGTAKRGLGPGIDVRGRGSYVLLPPSVVDGVEYSYAQA